jgi:hypothetical protein
MAVLLAVAGNKIQAQNLLSGGSFDSNEAPNWSVQEFATTSMATVNSISNLTGSTSAQSGDRQFFLMPWAGGSTAGPNNLTNAIASQIVPGVAGEQYNFTGWSRFEANYSGGVNTLAAGSPLGAVASPTTNSLIVEFLDSSNSTIGSPFTLNIKQDRISQSILGVANDNVLRQHMLGATAPVGTTQVRVTAEARDMVFNTDPSQAAFYDTFSLTTASAPATELLLNANLDDPSTGGLDGWLVTINDPANPPTDELFRAQDFAAHTGNRGIWISSFLGEPATPVSGNVSQIVPVSAGSDYSFTGWARFEANYNADSTFFEVQFLDGSSSPIGSPVAYDLEANGQTNNNTWMEHMFTASAPVGAVSARISAGIVNGVTTTGAQSAFLDDFIFELADVGTPGDFDGDGDVDGRDFLTWQRDTNVGDLADWQANYGAGGLAAVSAVPEPAAGLCLAAGLIFLGARRKWNFAR